MEYKIVSAQMPPQSDEQVQIEKTFTVEQKERFTISQVKQEIEMLNQTIANCEQRKADLEAKIIDVTEALDLKIAVVKEDILSVK